MSSHLSLLFTLGLLLAVAARRAPIEEGPSDRICGDFLWARIRGMSDQCEQLMKEYEPLPQERRKGGIVQQCCEKKCSLRTLVDFSCHDENLTNWFKAFDE